MATNKLGIWMPNGKNYWGDKRYEMLRSLGFDYVDIDFLSSRSIYYNTPKEELRQLLRAEKALADAAGVIVNQVHGPWRWPAKDSTPEDRAERMDKMKWSIEMGAILGSKNWVIHPIMPFGVEELDTPLARDTWDMNMAFMSEILEEAKGYDMTVCLENTPYPNFSLGKSADVLRFVKTMNDDHFKMCLDTGHTACCGSNRPGDEVRLIGDELRVLHVHDNNGKQDQHNMPYFGVVDWQDFGAALKEIDFRGVFSYEVLFYSALPPHHAQALCEMMAAMAKEML